MGTSEVRRRRARRGTTRRPAALLAAGASLTVLLATLSAPQAAGSAPAAPAPAGPATAVGATDPVCADAVVIGVVGGGQGLPDAVGADALGRVLAPVAQAIVDRAAGGGRTVEVVAVQAATPAPDVLRGEGRARAAADDVVRRPAWRQWRAPVTSLARGVRQALTAVQDCPDQLVHLVGYSQGAEAVHRVLVSAASSDDDDLRSRLVGSVLVGDGAREGHGVSARLARTPVVGLPRPGWDQPVVEVCSPGDVVCDLGDNSFRDARRTHLAYGGPAGRDGLAVHGRSLGARQLRFPTPVADQRVSGRVGLVMSEQLRVRVGRAARGDVRWSPTTALPDGLSLTPRGRLEGNPGAAGTTEIAYTVRNASDDTLARAAAGRVVVSVDADLGSRVSSGGRHACSVRSDSTLWCWGANFEGQLGVGDTAGRRKATQVGSGTDWASVSGGGMHTCATRTNGTLWCWGLNYRGQLGLGGRSDKTAPRKVGDARDWATVSAGWVHTCATRTDGSAWCWGNNDYGQLGIGSTASRYEPRRVDSDAAWTDLRAGGWSTCGVRRDGSAWCWGRNTNGELGLGDTGMRWLPNRIGDADDWAALRPSWTHTCGLRTSGAAQCWGNNAQRQLGTGKGASSRSPAPVAGDHVFAAVSTGAGFGCGTDTDGVLWCWGNGRYGQIGTGARTAAAPVRVAGEGAEGGFVGVESGWLHSCAVRASSAPYCWGENETGALGDGEDLDRSAPQRVSYAAGRRDAVDRTRTRPVDPVPGARSGDPARRPGGRARADEPYDLNVVSFNILGSNHSAPRKDAGRYSPARVRGEWALDHLAKVKADIVGFQEIQRDQLGWFLRGAGETYDVWPGTQVRGGLQTTIAWRQDTWEMTAHDTVDIPFITQTRAMPLVRLQHRDSGRSLWVMNVHNAPQGLQSQRNRAVDLEIDRLAKVVGKGTPVLLVGDFNERGRVYCEVARRLDMVAPRGGSFVDGTCSPPSKGKVRVDWIFGTQDASYSRYREDRSPLVKRITDHAVLRTRVSVP